jgi:hypothetical protein
MNKPATIYAEPEWLGRNDADNGRWVVSECNPRRGEPMTAIAERIMRVPVMNTELARVIRAHEMMHAKVSPLGDSFQQWIQRGIATEKAMTVVEELRVNFLIQQQGFDAKNHLADGGETADGERIANTNDWQSAVHTAIATAGTASSKLFLNGIRRHNRMWGESLADISKRAVKEMQKAYKYGTLASTKVDANTGLFPYGFSHTERIAEWVDRLASISPEELHEEEEGESQEGAEGESEEGKEGESVKIAHSNKGRGRPKKGTGKRLTTITPGEITSRIPTWAELKIGKLAMPLATKGNIGKKRTASNIGRSPRRMHRLITDPQMRVFDKVTRGSGGVVVIDASGSMNFTHEQIRKIVENAPGATVLSYSEMNGKDTPNAYVLADKGRMVKDLPTQGSGNGVDFPALEWAVKNRQRSNSPIIWVTDGGVCGTNSGFHNSLAMQCINFCKKHNIVVVPFVEEAISELRKMKNGGKPESQYPAMLRIAWQESIGTELPLRG